MEISTFLSLNCPSLHSGQFRDKKVSISMKNPSNYPIKCFARIKKITSCTFIIAGALIVKRDSLEKFSNLGFFS